MKSDLNPNESIVKEGPANLQKGIEAVGGRLFLTNQRVVFESHAMNIQAGVTEIPLGEVESIQPCWTKFLNLIPIAPNSLAVTTADAEKRFVLFGRSAWKVAIDEEKERQNAYSG